MNYSRVILAVILPIFFNLLTNLSEGYYPLRYVEIVDMLVFIGLVGTLIIEYYGCYLILGKFNKGGEI